MKKKKEQKSEADLVHEYVGKIIRGKVSRGHVDKRFDYTKSGQTVNKNLWLDTDFFFSIVFQSADQKYAFLEKFCATFGIKPEVIPGAQIQIVNGLDLAKKMNIPLREEKKLEYPTRNLDLAPFVLDNEDL